MLNIKTNINRAYLSDESGLIIIKDLPLNSLIPINLIYPNKQNLLEFDVFMEFNTQNIKIPNLEILKTSLSIIHNFEFSSISSLSLEPKNKFELSLNKTYEQILNLVPEQSIYLSLNSKNSALLELNIKNNLLIEPSDIFLKELKGTISEVFNF